MKYLLIALLFIACSEEQKQPGQDEFEIDTTRPPITDTLGVDTVETIQTIYRRKTGNEPRKVVYFTRIDRKQFKVD